MVPKKKNIIIFVSVAIALILVYIFFIKKSTVEEPSLVPSPGNLSIPIPILGTNDPSSSVNQDFLTQLLSVKSIQLNGGIFKDPAFSTLVDSSITLTLDGTQGRPNPFAPIGSEASATPANSNASSGSNNSGSSNSSSNAEAGLALPPLPPPEE